MRHTIEITIDDEKDELIIEAEGYEDWAMYQGKDKIKKILQTIHDIGYHKKDDIFMLPSHLITLGEKYNVK